MKEKGKNMKNDKDAVLDTLLGAFEETCLDRDNNIRDFVEVTSQLIVVGLKELLISCWMELFKELTTHRPSVDRTPNFKICFYT